MQLFEKQTKDFKFAVSIIILLREYIFLTFKNFVMVMVLL